MTARPISTSRPPARAEHRAALARAQRAALEQWIERAIALLDELDADPDLEPDACAELSVQPASIRGGARAAA